LTPRPFVGYIVCGMANNPPEVLQTADWAVLEVLSHPVRRAILRLCWEQARSVGELASLLRLNPGTVLHHMRRLERVDLVALEATARKRGVTEKRYRSRGRTVSFSAAREGLTPETLAPLIAMVVRDVSTINAAPAAQGRAVLVSHVAEPRVGMRAQQQIACRLGELVRWAETLPEEADGIPMRLSAIFGPRPEPGKR